MKKNVPAKENIIKQLRSHRLIIRNFGVRRLGLFGSFVRNSQRSSSDVDLLIEFEKGKKNFDNFIQLNFLSRRCAEAPGGNCHDRILESVYRSLCA